MPLFGNGQTGVPAADPQKRNISTGQEALYGLAQANSPTYYNGQYYPNPQGAQQAQNPASNSREATAAAQHAVQGLAAAGQPNLSGGGGPGSQYSVDAEGNVTSTVTPNLIPQQTASQKELAGQQISGQKELQSGQLTGQMSLAKQQSDAEAALQGLQLTGQEKLQAGSFTGQGQLQGQQIAGQMDLARQRQEAETALLNQRSNLTNQGFQTRLGALQPYLGQGGGGAPPVQMGQGGGMGGGEQAARAAAFARAKETSGQNALAAFKGLQANVENTGRMGSSYEAQGLGAILGGAQNGVNDFTREQLIQDLNRQAGIADETYQGNITQRGQDIQRQQAILALLNAGPQY